MVLIIKLSDTEKKSFCPYLLLVYIPLYENNKYDPGYVQK